MSPEWQPVTDSVVVAADAYDPEIEAIFIRFHKGAEWRYDDCPPHVWDEYTAPGQSRGAYVNSVLKHKPSQQIG